MKRKVVSMLLAAALVGSLAGTSAFAKGEMLDNGLYSKLVVAIQQDPQDLEGNKVNSDSRYYWIYGVYESLFDMADDGSGELKPCMASGYEETDDGSSWKVTLNSDITDWEGNNITANDVKFSFDKLVDDGDSIRFDYFDSIEVIDDYTFYIHWTETPPAISEVEFPLARTLVFSQKAYEEHGGFATSPVGTGCYKITEFVPGSKVVMEANDEYWGLSHEELEGRHTATVQTLELDVVSESATAVIGLETGTLDVCSYIPISMKEEFESDAYSDQYVVEEVVQGDYLYLCPNTQSLDEDLRKAIFYSIDNTAVTQAMGGQFVPSTTLGNAAYADYDESLELPGTYLDTYDTELAKEYLDASSYDGSTLTIMCINAEAQTAAAQMIQLMLQQIGVNAEINAVTSDNYDTIFSDTHSDEWDLAIHDVGGPSMVGSWHLLMDNEVNNGLTTSLVADDTLQKLYEAATADATHDAEHMKECLDYVIDNAYMYTLANTSTALVYTTDIEAMYYREGYYTPGASTFVTE